jgi:sRNA-binding carbon storage regulator CsrA
MLVLTCLVNERIVVGDLPDPMGILEVRRLTRSYAHLRIWFKPGLLVLRGELAERIAASGHTLAPGTWGKLAVSRKIGQTVVVGPADAPIGKITVVEGSEINGWVASLGFEFPRNIAVNRWRLALDKAGLKSFDVEPILARAEKKEKDEN